MHVDNLGSLEAITKQSGVVEERRSYDPFGQRRNPIWGQPPPASFTSKTTKGFTGQEDDIDLGLVNLNGRIYDPKIGRLVSVDPLVSNPLSAQSWNAYSYALNNPLKYIDPTGFNPEPGVIELPMDLIEASPEFRAAQTVRTTLAPGPGILHGPPSAAPETGGAAPTNDVSTTGSSPVHTPQLSDLKPDPSLPVVEIPHATGPGTDDPFGVKPPALGLDSTLPTLLEQLLAGDPSGGRTTFMVAAEPGFWHDLDVAFGDRWRQVQLRPTFSAYEPPSVRSQAIASVVVTAAAMVGALLTPGPADDMAVAAGTTAEKAATAGAHLNTNTATSRFGLYEIKVNRELYKIGKADLNRVTQSSGLPARVHQQVRKLESVYGIGNVEGNVVERLGEVTTAQAKAAESARLRAVVESSGTVPPGNQRSYRP